MRYDTLIIGAGFSGLAAGIRLAQFERKPSRCSRSHYLWGGLNSFYKLGGRLFDTGLHALTNFVPTQDTRSRRCFASCASCAFLTEALALGEQGFSEIAFPHARLNFSNDFELLRSEIARSFPSQTVGRLRPARAGAHGLQRFRWSGCDRRRARASGRVLSYATPCCAR